MDKDSKTNRGLNRREVLGTGLTGALLLAGYSYLGLKDAVAASRKSGKPLFSADALNALFPNEPNAEYKRLLAEAHADPVAFVRNHFTVPADQKKALDDFEKELSASANKVGDRDTQDQFSLQSALATAQRENLRIVAQCLEGKAPALLPGEVRLAEGSHFFVSKSLHQATLGPGGTTPKQILTRPGQQPQRPAAIPQQHLPVAQAELQGPKFAGTLTIMFVQSGR
jgi:hypothetical protein